MKLNGNGFEGNSLDLAQEELECMKQDDQEFWQSVRELMRYGVPAYDKQGHSRDFRARVRPLQIDMISAVREKMPEGWFKDQASLNRSILAVGCKVILRLMSMEKGQWHEILNGLNQMAKKARLEEFKKDMGSLRGDIMDCSTMKPQEKVRIIDMMEKLERQFMTM